MWLVLYSATVSLVYALIAIASPTTAEALIVAFVALLVVPAFWRRMNPPRCP
jgi:hypothetical protein